MSFNPFPLSRFALVINKLAANIRDRIDVKLIGPENSTGLQNMIREVCWYPSSVTMQLALDGISIISPRATASELALLSSVSSDEKSVKELLEKNAFPNTTPRGGLNFVRTIATDDIVLREMIAELARACELLLDNPVMSSAEIDWMAKAIEESEAEAKQNPIVLKLCRQLKEKFRSVSDDVDDAVRERVLKLPG